MTNRHKVFVSYYHKEDQAYRNKFERLCANVMESRSVDIGDIDPNAKTEYVRQRIRDKYLSDSTVTIVLIGPHTWQRKHVDWEISSSLRQTEKNRRSGIIGIILPTYPGYKSKEYDSQTIPPRLYDNIGNDYAKIYLWNEKPNEIIEWIDSAYNRKDQINPINNRQMFGRNHTGDKWQ